jgi:hypothetical protein
MTNAELEACLDSLIDSYFENKIYELEEERIQRIETCYGAENSHVGGIKDISEDLIEEKNVITFIK